MASFFNRRVMDVFLRWYPVELLPLPHGTTIGSRGDVRGEVGVPGVTEPLPDQVDHRTARSSLGMVTPPS
jgi:hypothetical protein